MADLVPLARVRAPEMNDVLAHEREAWGRELHWDFSLTTSLIARGVGAGAFAGFALRDTRRVVAYCYLLADAEKSLLGSVHALAEADAIGGSSRLVERALTHLVHEVGARRVESQFVHFGADDPAPTFARWGLRRYPRQFLSGRLGEAVLRLGPAAWAGLRPFRGADHKAAASVVHRSFAGTLDAEMSECYATSDGCSAFVEGILSRTGCGVFDPRASFVALRNGEPVGVVCASRVSPGVGHIVQISVVPEAQGRGIGRDLLAAACRSFLERGFLELSLSVSIGNTRARSWYLSLGLVPVKDFSAWAWTRG